MLASPAVVEWWNRSAPRGLSISPEAWIQIGAAIVGGAVVGIALLLFERTLNAAQESRHNELAARSERQQLLLRLSMTEKLDGIDLRRAELQGAYLRKKSLKAANLDGANLQGCNFIDCDFTGARIHNCDLKEALLIRANLKGVMWNTGTTWPSEELRIWVLERSKAISPSNRFQVRSHAIVPLGLGVPPSDTRFGGSDQDMSDVERSDRSDGEIDQTDHS